MSIWHSPLGNSSAGALNGTHNLDKEKSFTLLHNLGTLGCPLKLNVGWSGPRKEIPFQTAYGSTAGFTTNSSEASNVEGDKRKLEKFMWMSSYWYWGFLPLEAEAAFLKYRLLGSNCIGEYHPPIQIYELPNAASWLLCETECYTRQ